MFAIAGFPLDSIAEEAQNSDITYVGMPNEQTARYAAQALSYLIRRPPAYLLGSGPKVVHALSGLANAKSNGWPMILIGSVSATNQNGQGADQGESLSSLHG